MLRAAAPSATAGVARRDSRNQAVLPPSGSETIALSSARACTIPRPQPPSRVARNPVKMIMLFGGSALITLAYVGALAASVQAFGGGPGVILIGAVYMGAAAIAAAAPSPGGLGAIEAALIAGLTGVGMQAGPAVSAVLLYRLATYWLPVAPGWLSWRAQQRRDYV